jgi:hypothetical protein
VTPRQRSAEEKKKRKQRDDERRRVEEEKRRLRDAKEQIKGIIGKEERKRNKR